MSVDSLSCMVEVEIEGLDASSNGSLVSYLVFFHIYEINANEVESGYLKSIVSKLVVIHNQELSRNLNRNIVLVVICKEFWKSKH